MREPRWEVAYLVAADHVSGPLLTRLQGNQEGLAPTGVGHDKGMVHVEQPPLMLQAREVDRDKRRALLHQMEAFLLNEENPYIQMLWKSGSYLVSNQVKTEAGAFVVPPSLRTALKCEHLWLQK